jgi:hypothetical protein
MKPRWEWDDWADFSDYLTAETEASSFVSFSPQSLNIYKRGAQIGDTENQHLFSQSRQGNFFFLFDKKTKKKLIASFFPVIDVECVCVSLSYHRVFRSTAPSSLYFPTNKFSLLFFIFIFGLLVVGGWLFYRYALPASEPFFFSFLYR